MIAPDHRARLLGLGRPVTVETGTMIFSEGQVAEDFWILHSGRVALVAGHPGRGELVVETFGAGDLLGVSGLTRHRTFHYGARAVTRTEATRIAVHELQALIDIDPEFGSAITDLVAETLVDRLQSARARLLDLYGEPT
ncbi:Crp/Fnr family transcriptional regulator [Gordonia sp. NPDC003424]